MYFCAIYLRITRMEQKIRGNRLPFVVCRKRRTIHKAINKCFIDQVCLVKMNGNQAYCCAPIEEDEPNFAL